MLRHPSSLQNQPRLALLPCQARGWLAGESWLRFGKQLNYRQQISLGKQALLSKLSKTTTCLLLQEHGNLSNHADSRPSDSDPQKQRSTRFQKGAVMGAESLQTLKLAHLQACTPSSLQTFKQHHQDDASADKGPPGNLDSDVPSAMA